MCIYSALYTRIVAVMTKTSGSHKEKEKKTKRTTKSTTTSTRTTTTASTARMTNKSTATSSRRATKSKTTSTKMTTATATTSSQSSISNSVTVSSEESATYQKTWMSTPAKIVTLSSGVTPVTMNTALTTTQTDKTIALDKTTLSKRISLGTSDDSVSDVVPVVSVLFVVVIALAVVIVLLLWRHRRLKQQKAIGGYSGTSISNRSYEDDHGLDRHISLLHMRPDDLADSGYVEILPANINVEESPGNVYQTIDNLPEDKTEISSGKLNVEESPGNVYQTIDILPEDMTECISGYEHLKMQTTKIIDNYYLHVNHHDKPSSDATYAHTGNPTNVHEITDDGENETTYNHLERNARKTQGIQQPLEKEEKEVVDDLEAEYNHAKAGQLSLEPDNKGDTYSHLNNTWQKTRGIQQDDLKFLTHGSKTQTYGTKTRKFDSDSGDGKNTFPEYAKCAKKVNGKVEPKSKLADTDVSFQATNETFEDSESEESPNHQYFILEKTATDT